MHPSVLPDRTWAEINLEAVRANARMIVAKARGARLLPMVKANAYGLGAVAIAKGLEPLDPWGFGVATAAEGIQLRTSGIIRPILVVQPTIDMLAACADHGLVPVLGGEEEIRKWLAFGSLPFHVGIDTGMNRGGIWWEAFGGFASLLSGAPGFEGVATHFHSAERDPASVRTQWQSFEAAIGTLPARPAMVHAANSAAALEHPETAGDLVRPGIFLYGGRVAGHEPAPVLTWRARVCRVARREAGTTVSYGATFRTAFPTWVTTIAAGYADGYRRALSASGCILVAGRKLPVAGVVTMDFTMVVSADEPPEHAIATLIGTDGLETISLDDVAQSAGTISYEILTGLGPRVERIYR
jgi:alanine racemase